MNICMVGHGMMGVWHSEALAGTGAVLHTIVGRRKEPTAAFAAKYGYGRWTLSLAEALADPSIDAVIVTTPSEQHETHAIACLDAGKHVLLEIPVAMSLAGAERVVAAAARSGRICTMGHPMRFRPERATLLERTRNGAETIRHIAGRFFIHRIENVGATGYRRSWTDNILWHHFCHFVDLGMYLLDGAVIRRVQSHLGPVHPVTGIPMDCTVLVETEADQTLLVHGSYLAAFRMYDDLVVTDRDTYFTDNLGNTQRTRAGTVPVEDEPINAARVTRDFIEAIRDGRPPVAPAASALPAMRILQAVQDDWDARYGKQDLPGRALRSL